MNDIRLVESAASIVINMYTGILQGIPNLLDMLTEYKESSYYHDILFRDISFTKNAVIILADDISARTLEVKLQEKGIPFDKVPSALLEDHVKTNGRHVFFARELDYKRIVEAIQEVKAELSPKNHDVELILEDENELERNDPGQSAGKTDYKEENSDTEAGEKPEEDLEDDEPNTNKKKKEKSNIRVRHPTVSSRYPNLHSDSFNKETYRKPEADRIREQERNRQRDDDLKRAEENWITPGRAQPYSIDGRAESSRRSQYQPERSALASGNKNVNVNFGGHYESGIDNGQSKASEISVLGNGYHANRTSSAQTGATHRIGAFYDRSAGSRQSELLAYRQKEQKHSSNISHMDSKDILAPEQFHFLYGREAGAAVDNPSAAHGIIQIRHVDMNALYGNGKQEGESASQIYTGQHSRPSNDTYHICGQIRNFQRYDKTEEILKGRRFYQTRNLLSPQNFHNAMSGTKRVLSQSLVGRDTDSGRIANEVVDYISPAARLAKGKFLNSGAIEIARTTHCDIDVLTAAYAVKNNMTLNDARSELRSLRKLEANLLKSGRDGLTMVNDGAVMKKMAEIYQLQGQPASFIGMLRGFDNDRFAAFVANLNISDELRDALLKTPVKDLDILRLDSLLKKHGRLQDKKLLQMIRAGKIMGHYPGCGSFSALYRRYFTKIIKELGRSSDAARAFGTVVNVSRNVHHAYRSGIRLLYTVLRKFKVMDTNTIAAQVIADPGKVLGRMVLSKTKSGIGKGVARLGLKNARSVAKTKRAANHASSAFKFLKHTTAPLRNLLAKNVLVKKAGALVTKLSSKTAVLVAKAGVILGWIAVIIIIVIMLIEIFATMPESSPLDDQSAANYMYVQDTEIMQEIITELSAKNEAFISDINNAANHRGNYGTTAGLTANENVNFYETGAYNIVFRDAYGNELKASHVDLNNTKTILSMATKFIPYPFQRPSENALAEDKKAYEDIKQHFKDYCYFLWASTHQISIEEYHPGNSNGIEGAQDNSGLSTTLDKGICEQNDKIIWLKSDFTPDITSEHHCETCSESPATGLGAYYDDLCTHGKDGNEHGGWKKTGNKRIGINCKAAAKGKEHHDGCDHSEEDYNCYTCSEDYYKEGCSHWEYEWVYECGGHMGSVVYVTIGELSRMPSFPAADDVDYVAIGSYDTGGEISGSDITGTERKTVTQ